MELIPLVKENDAVSTRNGVDDDDDDDDDDNGIRRKNMMISSDHHNEFPDDNNFTHKMKEEKNRRPLSRSLSKYQEGEGRKKWVVTSWILVVLIGLLLLPIELAILTPQPASSSPNVNETVTTVPLQTIAFCGNSMTYYNDCPRLVELMLWRQNLRDNNININETTPTSLPRLQDSCLHGGANLQSLWLDGNGMESRFGNQDIGAPTVLSLIQNPPPQSSPSWNYIVLQDDEQYVTGALGRNQSIEALREWYLPEILRLRQQPEEASTTSQTTTVLFLQTFPYKSAKLRERLHLGGYEEFTNAIIDGYNMYKQTIEDEFGLPCKIVPMEKAALRLHEDNPQLWDQLYRPDDNVHPSPYATWLQSCLIYILITGGQPPPKYDEKFQQQWQQRARHWATTRFSNVVENDFTTNIEEDDEQEEEELHGGSISNSIIPTINSEISLLPPPTLKAAEQLRQLACQTILGEESC